MIHEEDAAEEDVAEEEENDEAGEEIFTPK